MSIRKGPPVALISTTVTKGDHPYAILKVKYDTTETEAAGNIADADIQSTGKTESSGNAATTNSTASDTTTTADDSPKTILCTYGIPSQMAISEFLDFVAAVDPFVGHYRVMRDSAMPETYMVLMKFRDPYSADNYFKQYNQRLFSSMEVEKCQIVYIEAVEIDSVMMPTYSCPFLEQQLQTAVIDAAAEAPLAVDKEQQRCLDTSDNGNNDSANHDESNCPVCLETMNERNTSLLTILCQHTFHCHCLSKWNDRSCPVCRYSYNNNNGRASILLNHNDENSLHSPSTASEKLPTHFIQQQLQQQQQLPTSLSDTSAANVCSVCNVTHHLWICLICGNIGCGRYENAHAFEHYQQTKHIYSLEIETQRVWDYVGDGYVHRLIQNAVDGKLVEVPADQENSRSPSQENEKLEALSIEYSYLLTSQLDSQRMYFETQMDALSARIADAESILSSLSAESDVLSSGNRSLENEICMMQKQTETTLKQKVDKEAEINICRQKYDSVKEKLMKEKEKTNTLVIENDDALKMLAEQDAQIDNLKEQIRDMTFFLEARQKVQDNPNLEGASVEVAPRPNTQGRKKRGKKRS